MSSKEYEGDEVILAVDHGKNVGVAMHDGKIVKPVGVFDEEGLFSLLRNMDFDAVVVGIPYNLKGMFSKKTFEVVNFALKIKDEFTDKKVFLYDERFTTVYGKKISGMDERKYRRFKDVISAVEILSDFLKSQHLACEVNDDKFIQLDERIIDKMRNKRTVVEEILLDPRDERLRSLNIVFLTNDPHHFYLLVEKGYIAYFRKSVDELSLDYDLMLKYKDGKIALCP